MEEINLFDESETEEIEEKQKCKYCGRELSTGFDFCIYCGKNLVHDYDAYLKKAGFGVKSDENVIKAKKNLDLYKIYTAAALVFFGFAALFFLLGLIGSGSIDDKAYGNAFGGYGGAGVNEFLKVISDYFCTLIFMFAGYILLRIRKK